MKQQLDQLRDVVQMAIGKGMESLSETTLLRGFTALRIPLIAFLGPRVLRMDDEVVDVEIPLGYRSRNHLNSMYFGSLATGADLAIGYLAFREIQKSGRQVSFVFKSFSGEFLKRAEADVTFRSLEVAKVRDLVSRAIDTGERVEAEFEIVALTPSISGDEVIARFKLILSMKVSNKKESARAADKSV